MNFNIIKTIIRVILQFQTVKQQLVLIPLVILQLYYNHFQQKLANNTLQMGNSTQIAKILYSTDTSPLTGNYGTDYDFLTTQGFCPINAHSSPSSLIPNKDKVFTKNNKLYAYRVIEGNYEELSNAIHIYNDLYKQRKANLNSKINNNSKIGNIQFLSLIPSQVDLKIVICKFVNTSSSSSKRFKAKLVVLLQVSAWTLDSLFDQYFQQNYSNTSITINNVQFLEIFGQLIEMAAQYKSKGFSLKNINPSQIYIQMNQNSQEQNKFSLNKLFYYPQIFHSQEAFQSAYMSPELFQIDVQQSSYQQESDKDLIFGLGLTLISLLIKKSCSDCYNLNAKSFCRSLLQKKIDLLQKKLYNMRQTRLQVNLIESNSLLSQNNSYQNQGLFQHILFSIISQMVAKRQSRAISTLKQVKAMYHQLTRSLYNSSNFKFLQNNQKQKSFILKLKTQPSDITTALTQSFVTKNRHLKKLKTVKRITQDKQNDQKNGNQPYEQILSEISMFKQDSFQNKRDIQRFDIMKQSNLEISKYLQHQFSNISIMNWQDENGLIIQPIKHN